jgi:putative ABC transport system permease protein
MGIRIAGGRSFSESDTADSVRVAIVERRFADRYWPGGDPIGRRFKLGKHDGDGPWWTIVGVAGTIRSRGAGEYSREQVYVPFAQHPGRTMFLTLKTRMDPELMSSAVRGLVQEMDPEQPISAISSMKQYLSLTTSSQRLIALLMTTFAALSMLLSVSGIYGLVSYSVRRRTHEIGVRVAIGAGRLQVLAMVFRQSMTLVVLGIGIGAAAALALTRLISGMLFGIEPADPATFTAVSVLMILVAVPACLVPARRAARIDPILALRDE